MTDPSQPDSSWHRAEDNDVWFRHIIENGAVRPTAPRVRIGYLEKELERVVKRPWVAEISGRLLSKAMDIKERAETAAAARAAQSIRFRHIIYIRVSEARAIENIDVYGEPNDDPAHANLVALEIPDAPQVTPNSAPKKGHEFYRRLAEKISVCDSENLSAIEALRPPTQLPDMPTAYNNPAPA